MKIDRSSDVANLSPDQLQRLFDRLADPDEVTPASALPPSVPEGTPAPLSHVQERIWFLERLDPGSGAYGMPMAVELRGGLSVPSLAAALAGVCARHAVLRARIVVEDGEPRQVVTPAGPVALPVVDLAGLPGGCRDREAERWTAAHGRSPLDLEDGPLLAAALLRLAPDHHRYLVVVHHVACDGWSIGLMVRETAALYEAHAAGRPSPLPPLTMQYADYAAWQRAPAGGDGADGGREEAVAAALRRLGSDPAPLELPTDGRRSPARRFRGGRVRRRLPAELCGGLRALARAEAASPAMALLAAVALVLHRWSGQDDLFIGSPIANRDRFDTENLIGCFLDLLIVRADLSGDPTFRELLRRVREANLDAIDHREVPLEAILSRLPGGHDPARAPFLRVLFNVLSFPRSDLALPGLDLRLLPLGGAVPTKFDLTFYVEEAGEGFDLALVHDAGLFTRERMEDLLDQVALVVGTGPARADRPVSALSLVTAGARERLPDPGAPLDAPSPSPVPERFLRRAAEAPDRIAAADGDGQWSYAALAATAGAVAGRLRRRGVGPEDVVAVWAHRSAPLLAALLGTLQAGAAFLVLDPAHPALRTRRIVERARPKAWIALEAAGEAPAPLAEALGAIGGEPLALGRRPETGEPTLPATALPGGGLAYLAATSGSTGEPKLVAGTHAPLAHFLDWHCDRYRLRSGERVSVLSGLSHDPLLRDLFTPLWAGAVARFPPEGAAAEPSALLGWMAAAGVTVTHMTPAHARLLALAPSAEGALPALGHAFFGGESLGAGTVRGFRALAPRAELVSFYGATETPQARSHERVADDPEGPAPLGRGIEGVQLLVLDRRGRPAGAGELGEVAVRTPHQARGYLAAAATAERFVPDPGPPAGGRIYRTGDLGRHLPDGRVVFAGRADRQVQVRGMRVELGEVEEALASHPGVAEAAVAARHRPEGTELVALVVRRTGGSPDGGELRRFLRIRLPEPMVPAALAFAERLPRDAQGKIDRRAVARTEAEAAAPAGPAEPRSELEKRIAAIWRDVLGRARVGLHDNFFDLGGHSLTAAQVHLRLVEIPEAADLSLVELFQYPTVAALARRLAGDEERTVRPSTRRRERSRDEAIAVIAMAGRFPGAPDVETFWCNLRDGVESVERLSDEELLAAGVPAEVLAAPGYVKAGAGLDEIERFDPGFFGYTWLEGRLIDPQHRIFLEGCWEVLERAGYDPGRFPGRIGVFGGVQQSSYLVHLLSRPDLVAAVGDLAVKSATDKDYLASRVAYKLGLRGPSLVVQTACSSSLVAVHLARQSLLTGESDLALAGGVAVRLPQAPGYRYTEGGIVSPDGHCRAFDAEAGGTVFSNGMGLVALKRLSDALADGDHLHAVLRGSAVNNDGADRVGFTAPGVEGQAEVVADALAEAGVDASSISYVEAHGTGTRLGDPIEVAALSRVFRRDGAAEGACGLGSVKTNVGHLDTASGIAGFLKTVLALEHRTLPPTLHFTRPNPETGLDGSPFSVVDSLRDWPSDPGRPRRAGVSSFGMGGTNAHAVLEEAPPVAAGDPSRPRHLLALSARDGEALDHATVRLAEHLDRHRDLDLADVAFTLQVGRRAFEHRRTTVLSGIDDAVTVLSERTPGRVLEGVVDGGDRPVVFLFPGQGVSRPGMARAVYESEPTFRRELDRYAELLTPRLGIDPRAVLGLASDPDPGDAAAADALAGTRVAQPVLFALELALARLWTSWGVEPATMIGHSLGEYVAACVAGVFEPERALELLCARGELMEELPAGAMLSAVCSEERAVVLAESRPGVALAAVDAPELCTLSGPEEEIERLAGELAADRIPARRVVVGHAFHSQAVEPLLERIEALVARARPAAPRLPFVSGLTGRPITAGEATDPRYWARQARETVRFGPGLARAFRDPAAVALEIGPGRSLSSTVRRHPELRGRQAIPSLDAEGGDREAPHLQALARLWVSGVEVDWYGHYAGERRRRVALPTYPFRRRRCWVDLDRSAFPVQLGGVAAESAGEPSAEADPAGEPVEDRVAAEVASGERVPRPDLAQPYVAPQGELERLVAEELGELLGIDRVGGHDGFFELGGHSLLATRLVARLNERLGVEDLSVQDVFDAPTPAALAARLAAGNDARRSAGGPTPAGEGDPEPLSFAQERLWFLDQLSPGSPVFNLPGVVRVRGDLDLPAFARALTRVAARHRALRTTFGLGEDGAPTLRVTPPAAVALPVVDLAALTEPRRDPEAAGVASAVAGRSFDLAREPLLRAVVIRMAPREHRLVHCTHHIVSDAWSIGVLVRDAAAAYDALVAGREPRLPELPYQYADFARWQRDLVRGERLEREVAYWQERLAGDLPRLRLPGRPPGAAGDARSASLSVTLPAPVADGLEALAAAEEATRFQAVLTAVRVLLGRLAAQDDVIVGVPVSGRGREELEGLIGLFVNTLPVRVRLGADASFREALRRTRESAIGAFAHQEVPFETLVERLRPDRDLDRHPLFEVLVNGVRAPEGRVTGSGLELAAEEPPETGAGLPLTIYVTESPAGVRLKLRYRCSRIDDEGAAVLLDQLVALLGQAVDEPERPIGAFDLVTEGARAALPDPTLPLPAPRHEPVMAAFDARAAAAPERIAVSRGARSWSYAELAGRSRDLARAVAPDGDGDPGVVAVEGSRSFGLVAAMLAALRTRAVLLVLDPSLPEARRRRMVEAAGARRVVRLGAGEPAGVADGVEEIAVDPETARLASPPRRTGGGPPTPGPDDPAYLFFTSGTTGDPKGIVGRHAGLAQFLDWERDELGVGEADRCSQLIGPSFDAVLRDVLLPLTAGARLCLPERPDASDPAVPEWLAREGVTRVHATPSLAAAWAGARERPLPLPALRSLLLSGEPLFDALVRRWRRTFPGPAAIVNLYGTTEATLVRCYAVVPERPDPGAQPVRHVLPATQALVLRPDGGRCGVGEIGEITLRTPFRARGYLADPEGDARRFPPNPHRSDPDDLLCRTGDLGRYRPDGALEVLGRIDDQVKVRGVRVEPREVEAALLRQPGVRTAAVVPVAGEGDEVASLAGYVVAEEGRALDLDAIRSWLRRELPDALVPSHLARLDELPLNASGKVDRRRLPAPSAPARATAGNRGPSTPVEGVVAEVWSDVLGVGPVAAGDDFFRLGGHSLLATRVAARLRRTLGVEVSVRDLFEAPELGELARRVAARRRPADDPPLLPVPRVPSPPLSFAQERLWFLDRLAPGSGWYNVPTALLLTGELSMEALARGLSEVARRHEALRTTLVRPDGRAGGAPVQVIHDPAPVPMAVADLRGLPAGLRRAEAQRRVGDHAAAPFDLARGPLVRAALLRLADDGHLLAVVTHHAISDAWSMNLLVQELAEQYRAARSGGVADLRELPVQYADFAVWQRRLLTGELEERLVEGWRRRLAGAPPALDLPTDRRRPRVRSFQGGRVRREVGPAAVADLRRIARDEGVSLFMVLLAAFQGLLARYSGQADLVVGSPVAGRDRPELERLIGSFVNVLALRGDLGGDPDFRTLLARTREVALEAYDLRDLPFERLVEALQPERDLGRTPLFQVVLVLQNVPFEAVELPGLALEPVHRAGGFSKFDLVLTGVEVGDRLHLSLEYNAVLFDRVTAERTLRHLHRLLSAAAESPDLVLSELPLLTEAEAHQSLVPEVPAEGGTAAVESTLDRLFALRADAVPDAVAVVDGTLAVSYGELRHRAGRLARRLRELGVGPESRVGLLADRSVASVTAMLGIAGAGGAYVPIDPAYPEARRTFVLDDSGIGVLVTTGGSGDELPGGVTVVTPEEWSSEPMGRPAPSAEPSPAADPSRLAYVIYTSGSTGRPKGVAIPHDRVVRLFRSTEPWFGFGPDDTWSFYHSPAFDFSVWEIWGALLHGGRLVVVPYLTSRSVDALVRLLARERVTLLSQTPSAFRELVRAVVGSAEGAGGPGGLSLESVVFGGEALDPAVLAPWVERHGWSRPWLVNMYGITETTVHVTLRPLAVDDRWVAGSPIGEPIPDLSVHLVDRHLRPVPAPVAGELTVGGAGLARGYIGRPGLTAERFVPDPFSPVAGARLYRSGDLARRDGADGLEYLGRIDRQVKIRGFRIELGEVETALAGHPAVGDAVVVARSDGASGASLAAYVVPDGGGPLDPQEVLAHLRDRLPGHMVPRWVTPLPALPLTAHGKLDVSALPAPDQSRPGDESSYRAPASGLERRLAELWAELLQLDRVGVDDNFFDLGGHSLLVLELQRQLVTLLDREVPAVELFGHPTVSSLARYLGSPPGAAGAADPGLAEVEERGREAVRAGNRLARLRRATVAESAGGGETDG